jgi:sulfotransferase
MLATTTGSNWSTSGSIEKGYSIMTERKYHFITGLPRSGSTLLSSILRQNPRFHSSITDPLATFVKGMIDTLQNEPGMKSEVPVERRKSTIQGMFDGFYAHVSQPVVFNTNRAWTYLTPQIKELYPQAKLLVTVRDIGWILDSFEQAHRAHPFSPNTVTGGAGKSVYERTDMLMSDTGVVGFPYVGVKQAITSAERSSLMLIEYDQLTRDPERIMRAVYNFLGETWWPHNFSDVAANWDAYDQEIGIPLHRVRPVVGAIKRDTILPPDIWAKYRNCEVWRQ